MAAPSINTKVKMDGEREYKAALAEIKSALGVLKSELNLTSEEFKDNADSVEALTKKGDVLERTILTQKEKIEQLEQALQSAAETYGEADERTNRWKTQLNNAEAELLKMERAQAQNNDAITASIAAQSDAAKAIEKALSKQDTYRDNIAKINEVLGVLESESRKVNVQYAEAADSVDALTAKSDVLTRQISAQKAKIAELEKGLDGANDLYYETGESTSQWEKELNNAQAELTKMERALRENQEALEDAEKAANGPVSAFGKLKKALSDTKEQGGGVKTLFKNLKEEFPAVKTLAQGLGDSIIDLADHFGIELPSGVEKAIKSFNSINTGLALGLTGIGVATAAVVKAEKELIAATKEAAQNASDIITRSTVSGLSTTAVQEFDYAAEQLGVSSDRIQDSLKEITNKMQEVKQGNEETTEAFANLGVMVFNSDGTFRNATDVFYDTVDALGEIQDKTARDALAMDLMSESAQELNPLIDAGTEALDKYAKEAHDMGYVLDDDALTALNGVDDGFQKLEKTQDAVKNKMAAEFAPYLTEALEELRKLIQKVGTALVESGAVDAFGSILQSALGLLEPLGALISEFLPALAAMLKPVAILAAAIADTFNVIVGIFTRDGDRIKTALGLNASTGQLSNMQRASGAYNGYRYTQSAGWISEGTYTETELRSMYNEAAANGTANATYEAWKAAGSWRRNASGADWFIGGPTLLGEHGAETAILPQGTRILTAQETRQSGGDTYNITIDARSVREFEDILRIVQERRRVIRMGGM